MSGNEQIDIYEIFENAIKDPDLLSPLDVDKLLEKLENEKNDYLANKTIKSIVEEVYDVINEFDIPKEQKLSYCQRLSEFRFVSNINELHKGKYIQYIRVANFKEGKEKEVKLMNGGIVVNILFTDYGTRIVLRTSNGKYYKLRFDDIYIFQKMRMNEQIILLAYGYLEKLEEEERKKRK
jgi:hypothetical protein